MSSLMHEVFAAIPPEQWSDGRPLLADALKRALAELGAVPPAQMWGQPAPTPSARAALSASNAAVRAAADARCAEMAPLLAAAAKGKQTAIARTFGYSCLRHAKRAVQAWQARQERQA